MGSFCRMARLVLKTSGLGVSTLELRLGVNRVGRDPENDFPLDHPTLSARHCEFILSADGVVLNDHDSTNGSFVNDQPVSESWLEAGQTVRLGDVEMLVESTEAGLAIPALEEAKPTPVPVQFEDGAQPCPRHADRRATFQCHTCREIMCSGCVRIIRIKGGKPHYLCVKCHNPCVRIVNESPKKKKGFLGFLQETVRLKFGGWPRK